jgi:hypothetical protein
MIERLLMSQCSPSKGGKNTRTITQISEYEYLIEGESDWARFGFEIDKDFLTFADLENGPFLHVGDIFFGKGKISYLQQMDSGQEGYIILKVVLVNNHNKQ